MHDPCDVTVFASIVCDCYYLRTIPERFGMRDPYVRDVPGWIAEYVCTAA